MVKELQVIIYLLGLNNVIIWTLLSFIYPDLNIKEPNYDIDKRFVNSDGQKISLPIETKLNELLETLNTTELYFITFQDYQKNLT